MTLPLAGKIINLRDWQAADLAPYADWLQPGHTWQETDGPYEPPLSADEISAQLERLRQQVTTGAFPTPRRQLVIADRQTNELLGRVSA